MDQLNTILTNQPLFLLILVWSLIWKGLALWRAARRQDKVWYVILLVLNTVGIAETNLINFKLYPNPAATFLNIKNTAIIESVIISDINGRLVKNSFTNTKEIKIDVADLKAGVYFIQVFSKGIPQTQKFIKE